MSGFIVLIVLALLLIGIGVFRSRRSKSSAWSGIVTAKEMKTRADLEGDSISKTPVLVVKLDGDPARTIKVEVVMSVYDQFEVGDKLMKQAGQGYPVRA